MTPPQKTKVPTNQELLDEVCSNRTLDGIELTSISSSDGVPLYYAESLALDAMDLAREAGRAEGREEQKREEAITKEMEHTLFPNSLKASALGYGTIDNPEAFIEEFRSYILAAKERGRVEGAREQSEKQLGPLCLAKQALLHETPSGCWATGPMTGDPIADLIICPGCIALRSIDEAIREQGEGVK